MPCSDQHFTPVSFDPSPGSRDPDAPPPKKGRGGPRPGSGAPKGNLNALKHGRTSKRQQLLIENLVQFPEVRETLIAMAARNRKRKKRAEQETADLLAELLRRVGAS